MLQQKNGLNLNHVLVYIDILVGQKQVACSPEHIDVACKPFFVTWTAQE